MNVAEIIEELKKQKIVPRIVGDQLKLSGETSSLSAEFIEQIKFRKAELMEFLKASFQRLAMDTIPPVPEASDHAVSNAQQRIWVLSQFEGGNNAYNITRCFHLQGTVIRNKLQQAFQWVVCRHESLRTVFREIDGLPRQIILKEVPVELIFEDLSRLPDSRPQLTSCIEQAAGEPFSLQEGPLFRFRLFQLPDATHALVLVIHHIISDGWSVNILMRDVLSAYENYCKGLIIPERPLQLHYKEYSNWQAKRSGTGKGQEAAAFWKSEFADHPEPLHLSPDHTRSHEPSFAGAVRRDYPAMHIYQEILHFCKNNKFTPFNFFRSVLSILLWKFSGQEAVTLGTVVSGRTHSAFEDQIGLYVNTLPLRSVIRTQESFIAFVKRTTEHSFRTFEHQDYPFDKIVEDLGIRKEPGRNPLFDVMMVVQTVAGAQNVQPYGFEISDLDRYLFPAGRTADEKLFTKFDLSFNFDYTPDQTFYLEIEYNTGLFREGTISRLLGAWWFIITQVLEMPTMLLADLEITTPQEKDRILNRFNAPIGTVHEKSIPTLLRNAFIEYSNRTALISGENKFTYAQLHAHSQRVAGGLAQVTNGNDHPFVGLLLERTEWTIFSILGILHAGCAYLPLDPQYPAARIGYMIADAGLQYLIVDDKGKTLVPENYTGCIIHIDEWKQLQNISIPEVLPAGDLREQNAYLIYTSGSTGNPKGVVICHRNVIAFLNWAKEEFAQTPFEILYATTSVCFDLSVFEIFYPLLAGKTIRLLESALAIPDYLGTDRKIMLNTVPSVVTHLLQEGVDLQQLVALNMAGEPVPRRFRQALDGVVKEIRNLYGPTEDTTYSTVYRFSNDEHIGIPIGKPVGYTHLYILDRCGRLAPEGVPGEIFLSGQSVAKGYYRQPALTAAQFLPNPFLPGMPMYRTGDLGRWLPDGNVAFLGRADDQVKVRGYRIEPAEIQSQLERHPAVAQAVVIIREIRSEHQLVAYWVPKEEVTKAVLKAWLLQVLPAYMVPDYWHPLEAIPLNSNGKLDKKQLPHPVKDSLSGNRIAKPENDLQHHLLKLWKQVLGIEKISITDNFFDLGGHSLKATRLRSLIAKELQTEITLNELFACTSIAQQAELLKLRPGNTNIIIPVIPSQADYPIASAQERLWIVSQFREGSIAYNMPGAYVFEGRLEVMGLQFAFSQLWERHESLRTVFRADDDGHVRQFIFAPEEARFSITVEDLQNTGEQEKYVQQLAATVFTTPFDLSEGPLFRACLYQMAADKWVFVFVMHHIISDGWSMGVLINELFSFYQSYISGQPHGLAPLRIQYKDYASWQRSQRREEKFQEHKNYWLKRFQGSLPVLDLPADKPRPALQSFHGGTLRTELPLKPSKELMAICQEQNATLFMGLLATVNVLLCRYTGQQDLIIGTPVAGREHADLENQIGFYVSTLALRTTFKQENNFYEILKEIRQVTLDAYAHQSFHFDELVNALDLPRDLGRNALFDVMVILQNTGTSFSWKEQQMGEVTITRYEEITSTISKFDLTFTFEEVETGILTTLEYNSDIFHEATAERLLKHLAALLKAIADQPSVSIDQLDLLSWAEKEQLLNTFNDTTTQYPKHKTLACLFEEQVARTPDHTALHNEDRRFTYRSLNDLSNQLAGYLKKKYKLRPNERIAVKLERNDWCVISILAILKAGCACVPVDPAYPQIRIDHMIRNSDCKAVIDEEELKHFRAHKRQFRKKDQAMECSPHDLAYVIYTSGSTGQPKGCMLDHRGVINHLFSKFSLLQLRPGEAFCHSSELYFVGGIWQLWAPLLTGGRLILCGKDDLKDITRLLHTAMSVNARILEVMPSQLNEYLSYEKEIRMGSIKTLILTGEKLNPYFVDKCYAGNEELTVINTYGQTESSDVTAYHVVPRVSEDASVLIGIPVQNTQQYILSEKGLLCPVGVTGEICTSGDGVCQGYLNDPELTALKFVENPFKKGKVLYKTGDLGRWLPSGKLEITGRKDQQIKIRGFRIETIEIENALLADEAIDQAVVVAKEIRKGERSLVAYVVSKAPLAVTTVRAQLVKKLPGYMIPAHFVQLGQLPVLDNGKTDRKALLARVDGEMDSGVKYIAPRNNTEIKLVELWKSILQKEKISVKDNFFVLGGHSLKAIRLASQIHKIFEVKPGLEEIFQNPVLEDQAKLIRQGSILTYDRIPQVPDQETYITSSSQRRLWILSQLEEGSVAYNMPMSFELEGNLDQHALNLAFSSLLQRHEILRTVFTIDDNGVPYQRILPASDFKISYQDLRDGPDQDVRLKAMLGVAFNTPFDLSEGPLLRAGMFRMRDDAWVFAYVMHHIISDGWSMGILMKDLITLYHSYLTDTKDALPPLPVRYRDYASWQQEQLNSETFSLHRTYWQQQFSGELPVMQLPVSRARPAGKSFRGALISTSIGASSLNALKDLVQEESCTLFMGVLAWVNTLLYRYTNQVDLIVGSPIANREHPDLDNQIGFYVNTLALRTRFSGSDSFRSLLRNVQQVTLEGYEHQSYPFDELVNGLALQRDQSRNPLFDVMVALQNNEQIDLDSSGQLVGLKIREYPAGHVSSKFDLLFSFTEQGHGLELRLEYDNDLYDRVMIERLCKHLGSLLELIIAAPDLAVSQLDFMGSEEKRVLLEQFNRTEKEAAFSSTILSGFAAQAALTPDHLAVYGEEDGLSYRELDEYSNQMGHYLRAHYKMVPDDLIGIRQNRGPAYIVSILGVLKAGAGCMPLDPQYPEPRLHFMEADSNCTVRIDDAFYKKFLKERAEYPVSPPAISMSDNNILYLIYTSGSTGTPKGIMMPHRSMVNLVNFHREEFGHQDAGRVLQFAGISFDVSFQEIFTTLLRGGTLYPVEEELKKEVTGLSDYIVTHQISTLFLPTAYFRLLMEEDYFLSSVDQCVKHIIVAGEQLVLSEKSIRFLNESQIILHNHYGPAETHVATSCRISKDHPENLRRIPPVGRPILHHQVYVMNESGLLVSPGVTGELYIGGAGVSRGYMNQPQQTSERFIPDPFNEGGMLYKTGDLGRWDESGVLEYLGRSDDQVKIRGYRVEPGEIESVLLGLEGIEACVVTVAQDESGEKVLVSYVVGREQILVGDLRASLGKLLPAYMIPAYFIQLTELPLTVNGKVDRKNLPSLEEKGVIKIDKEHVDPSTPTEGILLKIWQEVLGRDQISIRDNFFELGGHSLKAMRLSSQIHKQFKIKLALKDFFGDPTIESIAEHLDTTLWVKNTTESDQGDTQLESLLF